MGGLIDDFLRKIAPPCDAGTHDSDVVSDGPIFQAPKPDLVTSESTSDFTRFYQGTWRHHTDTVKVAIVDDFECVVIGPQSHWGSVVIKPAGEFKEYVLKAGIPLIGRFKGPVVISAFPQGTTPGGYTYSYPMEIFFYRKIPNSIITKRNKVVRGVVSGAASGFDDVPTSNPINEILTNERRLLGVSYSNQSGGAVTLRVEWTSIYITAQVVTADTLAAGIPNGTAVEFTVDVPRDAMVALITDGGGGIPATGLEGLIISTED